MNRLFLIIRREYLNIVARKSFIVMTLLIPLLSVLCMAAPALLMGLNDGDQKTVVVIDEGSGLADVIKDTEEYRFLRADSLANKNPRNFYESASDSVYAVVVLPQNLAQREYLSVFSDKPVQNSLVSQLKSSFNEEITNRNIAELGIPDIQEKVEKSKADVRVSEILWSDEGEAESGSAIVSQILGIVFAMFAYMFVLMYGAMIMNGVIEEKTNRIVEVIVSSCKPLELMLGKIIGVALVGFTQLVVWGALMMMVSAAFGFGGLFMGMSDATETINAMSASRGEPLPAELEDMIRAVAGVKIGQLLFSFLLFGIGGFLLYGSLFAAFGSAADQPSDASQFTTPIIMIEVFALWAGMACIENPDGPLAMWCSFIPFTSTIVMMVRLPYGVPTWELALSIALLFGTALTFLWLAGRIYRRGILMYGKKVSVWDIFRWIK
ncbi:MAG: ABC transporter permease [Muribaculaceae bacterium]|nr:ABC transporter permease [Muribaculaceae bacterium]